MDSLVPLTIGFLAAVVIIIITNMLGKHSLWLYVARRWPRIPLYLSGWRRSRNVWDKLKLPPSLTVFPKAKEILAEYGGLRFGDSDYFEHLDPYTGEEVADLIKQFEQKLEKRFYPVGIIAGQDEEYILVDEKGVVFLLSDDGKTAWLKPWVSSFDRAIILICGRMSSLNDEEGLQKVGMSSKQEWQLDLARRDVPGKSFEKGRVQSQ